MIPWNAVAVIAPALLPVAVLGLPVLRAIILPHAQLNPVLRIVYVDADRNSILRIPAIVQIVSVIGVINVHIIVFIPVV